MEEIGRHGILDGAARLEGVRERLARACSRSGRDPESVRLIAVSKTRPVQEIETLAGYGVQDFAENKIQEAEDKIPRVSSSPLTWHLVGHLQKNKVKKAVALFDWIHSIDSESIASRVNRLAGELSRSLDVLVQVDLAGEETKSGMPVEGVEALVESIGGMEHLRCAGLMVLPPMFDDVERTRPFFCELRELSERLRGKRLLGSDSQLSMGMSHDFEVAIEEGATMVRVGTAIFGPRAPIDRSAVQGEEPIQ